MPYRKNYKKNYGNFQKKKWASFLKDITPANVQIPAESVSGGAATLVVNAAQDATPTPTIIKVKHCKLAFDFQTVPISNKALYVFVIFLKELLQLILLLSNILNGLWLGVVLRLEVMGF